MISNNELKVTKAPVSYDLGSVSALNSASFSVRRDYVNYTSHDLYMKTQTNIPLVIEPNKNIAIARPGSFVEIKSTYTLSNSPSFMKTKELIETMTANGIIPSSDTTQMLNKMYEEIKRDARTRGYHNFSMSTVQYIDETELKGAITLFNRETDVLMSQTKEGIVMPHPNSTEGFNHVAIERNRDLHGFCGTFVRVIDNEQITPSLFYYSGKQIIEVPAVVDLKQQSGVYVTISSRRDMGLSITTEFMDFEVAQEKIGLYRTRDQAYNNGSPDELIKAEKLKIELLARERDEEIRRLRHADELARLEHEREVSRLKQDNAILKESLEIASARRSYEQDTRKHNIDQTRHQYEERKVYRDDYFDRREKKRKSKYEKSSTTMKVIGESLKYVPAIVLAGLGIYAATRDRG